MIQVLLECEVNHNIMYSNGTCVATFPSLIRVHSVASVMSSSLQPYRL